VQVRAAAWLARLDAAIARMPDGFDTGVGERGLKLSGGEKQRVAIARAFLRDPLLLICDEATSALDSATERGIMASLEELSRGRTSVFVAHRLSTVRSCDKILVLSEGSLVEEGSHEELMAAGGVYADMWAMQVRRNMHGFTFCPHPVACTLVCTVEW
jgi:ABC-type multidrug transport system fused ATPase/permease subunit